MKRFLVNVGNDTAVIKPLEAQSLNAAVSQALLGLALFLPADGPTPPQVKITVMDMARHELATINFTTLT